jgi:hypothetical protein
MALDDSFITPDHFRDIVHVARDHGLESQTVASAFFFLTNTASQNVADIHLVKVLGVFSARSELLHVARFHPSEGVAKEAVAELSYDHPEVAEWLRSEREALQRAMGADQALFLDRQKRLENALVETVARLEATQVIFTEYGQRLAAAEQRADNLKERQKELKDQLESLEKSLAVHRELVSGLQTSEKEREAELKKVYDALLKTWNSEHITINGTTYKKVRSASGIVKIDSNSRNHNFDLTVHAGEKVLFVITSSGLSEAQKSSIDFRLKRDKKNAKDKDVRKPLRHGDVWVGENYVSNGTRFYVKHESGLNVTGRFYVVTRADPKPELKYKVDTKTQKMIDRAKERIEELSEKQKELSEEATSFTGR